MHQLQSQILALFYFNEIQTPWNQTPLLITIRAMPRPLHVDKNPLPLRLVFARNIRLVRIQAGISQESMAAEAGLDRAFVGTLERGQRNISIDNVELICKAIGLPAHELMDPNLPEQRKLDVSLTRSPRKTRVYPAERKQKVKS